MIRNNGSTPGKNRNNFLSGSKPKRKSVFASPGRHSVISPRKQAREGESVLDATPTKSFALDSLDAALSHYFSPKRKASKSPARRPTAQKRLNFDVETDSGSTDDEQDENGAPPTFATTEEELKCDLEGLAHCFSAIDAMLPEPYANWEADLEGQFDYWTQLLRIGQFSLLLHGVGSKRVLLESFATKALAGRPYAMFRCYQAGANCKHIFDALNSELQLGVVHRGISVTGWALRLRNAIESQLAELFVLVHNIDAPCMRDPQQQRALSILAESESVRLVATVDHKNAPLLWDLDTRERFNWLLVRASTLRTYGDVLFDAELKSLGLNAKLGGRQHNFASLDVFWHANPEKARNILKHLAIHAGSVGAVVRDETLSLSKLCRILKQDFITNSEATLRAQLNEFVDSAIIRIDKDGTILLNVDRNLLVQFLETKNV